MLSTAVIGKAFFDGKAYGVSEDKPFKTGAGLASALEYGLMGNFFNGDRFLEDAFYASAADYAIFAGDNVSGLGLSYVFSAIYLAEINGGLAVDGYFDRGFAFAGICFASYFGVVFFRFSESYSALKNGGFLERGFFYCASYFGSF